MLIGLGEDKTPTYFGFTRSKVKVTRVSGKIMISACFSRELSIPELQYVCCLVLVRTRPPIDCGFAR